MKGPALAASVTLLAGAGFGAAHALAGSGPQQVTLPTTLPGTVTVTLPVTTATVPLPTTSAPLPTVSAPLPTTAAPLPTTAAPLPTTSTPVPTTAQPPGVPTTSSGSPSPASSSPGSSASAQSSSSSPSAPARGAAAGSSAGTASAPVGAPSGGLTVASTPPSRGRPGRRPQFLGFRLGRPARIVAVFRGPAPSCEIEYTFRARGRPGTNRVPASALVRKGLVEAGVYAVRVVVVRGEHRRRIGDIVVDVRRLRVRQLPRDRHRCLATAPRGMLLAVGPSLGGPVPPQSVDGVPGHRGDLVETRRGDVAAAPEVERLSPLPVGEPGDLPVELLFGAIVLALIALAGMAVSVRRALR